MKLKTYKVTLTLLTLAGFLFSGYLSAIKFFTNVCFVGETCPSFLGHPACWYGLGMFTVLFVSSLVLILRSSALYSVAKIHSIIGGLGFLFSGYFAIPEIILVLQGKKSYIFGLPTCAYGFFFFTTIFLVATISLQKWSKAKALGQGQV